jgi:GntR family transcriptional regulator
MPRSQKIFERTPRLIYFRENGLEITHVTQTLSAVAATAEVARALEVPEGSPLLSLERTSFDESSGEAPFRDHLTVLYNPEHFQYRMDLKVD